MIHALIQPAIFKNSSLHKAKYTHHFSLRRLAAFFVLLVSVIVADQARAEKVDIEITYLVRAEEPAVPLSLLDLPVVDEGMMGVRLGLADSQTTGNFLGHVYTLDEIVLEADTDIATEFSSLLEQGRQLFIADLKQADLEAISALSENTLIFNIRAKDDVLRGQSCHSSVLHIPPSRSMLTDALAQYLAWKRWSKLILVTGRHDIDAAWAMSMRRSAKRFGLKLVQEKDWTAVAGARRTDSGHHSLQQEVPQFTQFKDHDVLIVADESDEFGEYLSYRSTRPRPVAGTQGLIPTSWHRTQEQWGATQIQRRFEKLADRTMTERDYAGWAAMRALADSVTNTGSADAGTVRDFLLSPEFKLAGFKGVPLTFRDWNGQLRQPILLAAPRMLISVSPQAGFLHEHSELDTLGVDKPLSECKDF